MVRLSDVRVTVLQCYKVLPARPPGLGLSDMLSIPSCNGRQAVTCAPVGIVRAVSSSVSGRVARFLISARESARGGFLMPPFLNAYD